MPREGSAARKRARLGLPDVKPGKPGWVRGTKIKFFEKLIPDFLAAAETGKTGKFYDSAAQAYLAKYGYCTPWDGDLEEGQEVADDVDPDEDSDLLDPVEAAARHTYYKELRAKIGVHFNSKCRNSKPKKTKAGFKQIFDKKEMEPPAPVKPRVLAFYSHHFYHERIEPRVKVRWAAASRLDKPPALITLRNAVTKECWLAETEAFRADVIQSLEKEHEAALEGYKIALAKDAPSTAEEYNIALNNAAFYLQPFADAAHEQFGMNVAILLCGPIPDLGGRIEMRSVLAGLTNELVPRSWNEFDRGGFDATQRSFVSFSRRCFTEDQCRSRAVGTVSNDEEPEAGMSAVPSQDPPASTVAPAGGVAPPPLPPPRASPPRDSTPPRASPPRDSTPPRDSPPPPPPPRDSPPPPPPRNSPPPPPPRNSPPPQREDDGDRPRTQEEDVDEPLRLLRERDMHAKALMGSGGFDVNGGGGEMFSGLNGEDGLGDLFGANEEDIFAGLDYTGPGMGDALAAEIAGMPLVDGLDWMERLGTMTKDELAAENAAAEARALAKANASARPNVPPKDTRPAARPAWRGAGAKGDGEKSAGGDSGGVDDAAGAEKPGEEGETIWVEEDDVESWHPELRAAYAAFQRGSKFGGKDWRDCVKEFIRLERAHGFVTKGKVAAPHGDEKVRPEEVPAFMNRARKWERKVALKSAAGPADDNGSFGARWWGWWKRGQPSSRVGENETLLSLEVVASSEWERLANMVGKNGLLLYVGALLWWGEAAAESERPADLVEDWLRAVVEVRMVLEKAAEVAESSSGNVASDAAETQQTGSKRKRGTLSEKPAEKENEEPRKLRRRRE
ncbi:hypothetical protein R3P38DRAFT_2759626 [Favolaschia claudopus]|uniref:Uncharacterized protein n=1 Tax=Favolaschia claudopus TaxID=2862362 RepID=A0AAW0E145_9AGAR